MPNNATRYQNPAARVLIPALAFLMLLASGCSDREATAPEEAAPAPAEQVMQPEAAPPAAEPEAAAPEPAAEEPAAEETAAAPAEVQAAAVDGQKVYQTYCQACHATGVAGAPKTGDTAAWAPRIAKGNDALVGSVTNGLNAMPPKGACMTCSDEELRAAVQYLVEQGS